MLRPRIFPETFRAYVPEFFGFCVAGVAHGAKVDGNPQTAKVANARLYLNDAGAFESVDKLASSPQRATIVDHALCN
jgi:hypothetical protein